MGAYALQIAVEQALAETIKAWTIDGVQIFGQCDVMPGHTAWPRMFDRETAATEDKGVPGGFNLSRLDMPLITFYGRRRLTESSSFIACEVEMTVRSPWTATVNRHAYYVDALEGFFQVNQAFEVNGQLEKMGSKWTVQSISNRGEDDRGENENTVDGNNWVATSLLYVTAFSEAWEPFTPLTPARMVHVGRQMTHQGKYMTHGRS